LDEQLEAMSAASRDRTNEFHAVLKSMKGRQVNENFYTMLMFSKSSKTQIL